MIPSPIHKVLSTLCSHEVQHLLMGGQACVFYGAAEFSRDCDIVVPFDDENFVKLRAALNELQADCIAIPPMDWTYLTRGHAIHFRCKHPEATSIRLDIMAKMRGCDDFPLLWERRTTLQDSDGVVYQLLGIEDLIQAKKTQRDKDWPMIRRLVDAHFDAFESEPTDDRVMFWLRESRSPEVLISLAGRFGELARKVKPMRSLLEQAIGGHVIALRQALESEQAAEKAADIEYWQPLKEELEKLQAERRR